MKVITPENCGKHGKLTTTSEGCQIIYVKYRCKDRVNCNTCRYVYVTAQGRLPAIEAALKDGANVLLETQENWGAVKKALDRSGHKDYIRIKQGDDIYLITHAAVPGQLLDHNFIDFETIVAQSAGRSQFKGKYDRRHYSQREEPNRMERDYDFWVYLPIMEDRRTGKIIPPDRFPKAHIARMYVNPVFGNITTANVQEFMIWRAEAMASVIVLENTNWRVVAFYREKKYESRELLDSGEAITYREVPRSRLRGPEINDATEQMIDAIIFGEQNPIIRVIDFQAVEGRWERGESGEIELELIDEPLMSIDSHEHQQSF